LKAHVTESPGLSGDAAKQVIDIALAVNQEDLAATGMNYGNLTHKADLLARLIHERSRVRESCAGGRRACGASGFDTARRAVLKASPGRALSEGPKIGPESKPHGRTIRLRHE
jgi:hypothetical protein